MAVPVLLLVFPLLIVRALAHFLWSALLCSAVWARHAKWVLFVYSDSNKWKEHVETEILPGLYSDAVVINRSRPWVQASLAGRIFRHFGGQRDFCPIGIVVERWRPVRVFRLFKPFQEAKQGDSSALNNVQAALLAATRGGR